MADFQRRKRLRRALYSPLSIVLLSLLTLLLARGVWNIWQKERVAVSEAEGAARELAALESRQEALSASINRLQSPRGQEEEIRQKFGATKEGEGVIVILGSPSATTTTPELSWWQRFLEWF